MKPHLTTSASPAIRSRAGSVSRKPTSATTARGWWNAPTRFLPAPRSTPVLPPTEASTIASSVVGTSANGRRAGRPPPRSRRDRWRRRRRCRRWRRADRSRARPATRTVRLDLRQVLARLARAQIQALDVRQPRAQRRDQLARPRRALRTCASISTATPGGLRVERRRHRVGDRVRRKRADADVVAAVAQRDVNGFAHASRLRFGPLRCRRQTARVRQSRPACARRCRRARAPARRTAAAHRAACAPSPTGSAAPSSSGRPERLPARRTASSGDTSSQQHPARRQHRAQVLLTAGGPAPGRDHRLPPPGRLAQRRRSRASGTRPPPRRRRCRHGRAPPPAITSSSRSTNFHPSRSASSRPTVVLPEAMKPTRKIGASSSAEGCHPARH